MANGLIPSGTAAHHSVHVLFSLIKQTLFYSVLLISNTTGMGALCCGCFVHGKTQARRRDPALNDFSHCNSDVRLPPFTYNVDVGY